MSRLGIYLMPGVAAVLLMAAIADAQQDQQRMRQQGRQAAVMQELQKADDLIGTDVENPQGEDLGSVVDLVIDPRQGRVHYVVLSRGEVLGIGGTRYPIPWNAIRYSEAGDRFILDMSEEVLEAAPNFEAGNWPNLASRTWRQRIDNYYRTAIGGTRGRDMRDMREPGYRERHRGMSPRLDDEIDVDVEAEDRQVRLDSDGPFQLASYVLVAAEQGQQQRSQQMQDQQRQGQQRQQGQQQAGQGVGGTQGQQQIEQFARNAQQHFQAEKVQSVTGKVQDVQVLREQDNLVVATIQTEQGQQVTAVLGPQQFLRQNNVNVQQGKEVMLRGSLVSQDGQQRLIATTVQADDEFAKLRSQQGNPAWQDQQQRQQRGQQMQDQQRQQRQQQMDQQRGQQMQDQQRQQRQQQMDQQQAQQRQRTPMTQLGFDPRQQFRGQNLRVVTGTVQRVAIDRSHRVLVASVQSRQDDQVHVVLGPPWYMQQNEVQLNQGRRISVKGSPLMRDNQRFLIATGIATRDGEVLLRNRQGNPAWTRQNWEQFRRDRQGGWQQQQQRDRARQRDWMQGEGDIEYEMEAEYDEQGLQEYREQAEFEGAYGNGEYERTYEDGQWQTEWDDNGDWFDTDDWFETEEDDWDYAPGYEPRGYYNQRNAGEYEADRYGRLRNDAQEFDGEDTPEVEIRDAPVQRFDGRTGSSGRADAVFAQMRVEEDVAQPGRIRVENGERDEVEIEIEPRDRMRANDLEERDVRRDGDFEASGLVRASKLMDRGVINRADERLGELENLVIVMATGQIRYGIVEAGGVLGMGGELHAVPWRAMSYNAARERLVLNISEDRFEDAPGFKAGDWPDMHNRAWQSRNDAFYRIGTGTGAVEMERRDRMGPQDRGTEIRREGREIIIDPGTTQEELEIEVEKD